MKVLLICLFVCFIGAALAQINSTASIPAGSSPDVSTAFVFPDHSNKAGDIVEVLLGFVNHGEREFNITSLSASLNHPLDLRYYIQNYTRAEYGLLVQPKEQVSVSYRFRPDPNLEPRDFALIVSVFYEDESGMNFTNAFFNGTISIVEADTGFDLQQLFLYVGFLGVLGLAGYFGLQSFGVNPTGKKERRASGSFRTPKVTKEGSFEVPQQVKLDDDWLAGTNVARASPRIGSPARTASPARRRASGTRM